MSNDGYPRARVYEVDGQLVLDDPDALAVIRAIDKDNCLRSLPRLHGERVGHFLRRIEERGQTGADVVVVFINVDSLNGKDVADMLMPDNDAHWQSLRDQGMVPFARGLAQRKGIQRIVEYLDPEEGEKMKTLATAIVVMDFNVVAVFAPDELPSA